jgi:hypothetical protein
MSERALPQRRSLEREASLQSDALTSAATGDHRDFAFAASAEGADPAWRRAEMDIKLRMAVYGLALNPLAVDVRPYSRLRCRRKAMRACVRLRRARI